MTYLSLITPTNIANEKEKFFASSTYSPQFTYKWGKEYIQKFKQTPNLTPLIKALLSQNNVDIERAAMSFFDVVFRSEDIAFAEKLVRDVPPKSSITADDYAHVATKKLAELGIDYRVEIVDKHGFQGRPDHKAKVLRLSKYLHPEFYSAEGLVNHELVHIVRALNGNYNSILAKPGYIATEEGLASLVQDKLLKVPTASAFQHALEYLAAKVAREHGFREVYDFLIAHGNNSENAWLRGIRQKYGICDTSQPGSLMRSGMVFYHELQLATLTEDELFRLFVAKIPLSDLSKYPEYTGQIPLSTIEALFS